MNGNENAPDGWKEWGQKRGESRGRLESYLTRLKASPTMQDYRNRSQ